MMMASAAGLPSWYRCRCTAADADSCVCPSLSPPGGLAPGATPQFILFTHDDAVTAEAEAAFRAILGGRRSADGCPASATLFALARGTDCALLRGLFRDGYEVASHSLTHQKMNGWGRPEIDAEVAGGRQALVDSCGIPGEHVVGWRAPFLQSSAASREAVLAAGYQYDSTILEVPEDGALSQGMGARLWPYTLQDGVLLNCERWSPWQDCDQRGRYPGLFEVPAWDLSGNGLFATNASERGGRSVYDTLRQAFDASYAGNRAPLPVYVHSSFFTAENVRDMQQFADYALGKQGTYFVTMRQLIGWMRNPVPAAQLTPAALGCGSVGGAPGSPQLLLPGDAAKATATEVDAATTIPAEQQQQQQKQQEPAEMHVSKDSLAAVVQQPATAGSAATAGAQQAPVVVPAAGPRVDLGAVLGGVVGGAAAAAMLLGLAALAMRRRQRRSSAAAAAAGAAQRSAYATHLYSSHMQHGAIPHLSQAVPSGSHPAVVVRGLEAALRESAELAVVVEQSGTPLGSARRRPKTAFN
ncbi:Polysaccharide deacetylase domain-containing [Micractinium conductrix]|uniref:Polysaccharide deacetylase domain-containing n=1 Tax=Micractinium conductrix TaxID=554055 RepID=A0A2P6VQL7_9CHLO|nr:Polysaccharide deacetylase domain-containing [Micractinium conductrix]|eukprot:PSC76360.1 Polysaccharide deacetylase domain-containing [Micractinium conductrix]